MKKPCFFCFRNTTLLLIIGCALVILYFVKDNIDKNFKQLQNKLENSISSNNLIDDIEDVHEKNKKRYLNRLNNPLYPPQRSNTSRIAVNIPTRGESPNYQQVGVITKDNNGGDPTILPLYGKPTYPGSSQWNYYTGTDKYNSIKLPISNENRDCQNDQGCKEIYDGDSINVPVYGETDFKTTIYKFDAPRYIPYI